ncbi:MAG: Ig-like domain-containing protein [Prevotellaceae bacterium]|jgi:uncharacterized protein YjdB|nr:Ig-like domain-containing protein [Prevotellaceae bacterium]
MEKLLYPAIVLSLIFVSCSSKETVSVTGITLHHSLTTRAADDSFTLNATVSPLDATNKTLTWLSTDETVAIVSNGLVITKIPGSAKIVVSTVDGAFIDTTFFDCCLWT